MKIAVVSGKGGSGKSSVTAALVVLAAADGRSVVAVDCDVDASNLPLLLEHEVFYQEQFASGHDVLVDDTKCVGCGICAEACRFNAISLNAISESSPKRLAKVNPYLCEDCGLCIRLCPKAALDIVPDYSSSIYKSKSPYGVVVHGDLNPGDDNSGKMIARLRELADSELTAGREDDEIEILDGPPGIGCPVLSTITGVDRVVFVCEPSLSGISDFKRVLKVCKSFCNDFLAIINKCDINEDNCRQIRDICTCEGIEVVAELPLDRDMVRAQLECKTIIEYKPQSTISAALRAASVKIFRK